MKKMSILLLVLLCFFTLFVSCDEKEKTPQNQPTKVTSKKELLNGSNKPTEPLSNSEEPPTPPNNPIESTGLTYQTNPDGTCTITGMGTCKDTYLVLPNKIDNYPVTCISGEAFVGNKNITKVIIPDSVTEIGIYAFENCSNLKELTIGQNVTTIRSSAFARCTNLENVTLPDNLKTIESFAFSNCSALTDITIPDGITLIGEYAFQNCTSLLNATVGGNAIDNAMFHGCSKLSSLTVGKNVTQFSPWAFEECPEFSAINVSVENSKYRAEANCLIETKSKYLIIAFENSVIPTDGSVECIGASAFIPCENISSIVIPNSITKVVNFAFNNCKNLKTVYYGGIESEWNSMSIYSHNDPLTSATRYYYSETQPTASGNYWRYVDGVPTAW